MIARLACAAALAVLTGCNTQVQASQTTTVPAAKPNQTAAAPGMPASATPASAPIEDRFENDWAHKVRPFKRRAIASMTINATGQGQSDGRPESEPVPCGSFKPTAAQMKRYLERAKVVSKQTYAHDTTWSACYAEGELKFKDGVVAQWIVGRQGAGMLVVGGEHHYLYCEDCALAAP